MRQGFLFACGVLAGLDLHIGRHAGLDLDLFAGAVWLHCTGFDGYVVAVKDTLGTSINRQF